MRSQFSAEGAADRHVVDDAAVDQHVVVDRHRGEDGRDGRGGQDGLDGGPVGDPAFPPVAERRRHHLDRDGGVLEVLVVDARLDDGAEPRVGVHGGALLQEGPGPVERAAGEDVGPLQVAPDGRHAVDPLEGRVAGVRRTVDGADRGAEDPVRPDAAPDQLLEHAHLDSAPAAAACQHEGRPLRRRAVPSVCPVPPLPPARAEAFGPAGRRRSVRAGGVGHWPAPGGGGGRRAADSWRCRHASLPARSWRTAHTMTITISATIATMKTPKIAMKAASVAGAAGTRASAMQCQGR